MAPGTWPAHPSAEIAEIRWLDLEELSRRRSFPPDLAPLLTEHILPELDAARRAQEAAPQPEA
jgi:hypothetical protein